MIGAPEDEDPEVTEQTKEPYIPGVSRALTADEILEPDYSVYLALHQLSYTWPCLSFDVLRDDLGWERNKFPHTAWVVAGTQAAQDVGSAGMGKPKDEVVVMKWGGLSRTRGEESDDEDEENEDADEYDEDAHLEFLSIPHTGGVNRIRAQRQPNSTGLPPAPGTPYHVATMADTGKVHIFDVRPMVDQLASPSTALPRTDKSKRPIHTITNHGRTEGFALDWSPASSSSTDLRLLSGDIASNIYHTALTPTGFSTQPKPFLSHTSSIEDLQWSPSESTVFASCSADRSVRVWDVRVKNRKSVTGIVAAHDEDVNVISWNTGVEYLLCSGGDEGGIKVWDLRNLKGA
jgi:ribosome assembly protein RRB1